MLEFIKMFGLGILYTIAFPVIVVVFAIYLIYAFCNYLVMESITLFRFFFGYTFSTETEVERVLREQKEEDSDEKNSKVVYEYNGSYEEETEEGSDEQWVTSIFWFN